MLSSGEILVQAFRYRGTDLNIFSRESEKKITDPGRRRAPEVGRSWCWQDLVVLACKEILDSMIPRRDILEVRRGK